MTTQTQTVLDPSDISSKGHDYCLGPSAAREVDSNYYWKHGKSRFTVDKNTTLLTDSSVLTLVNGIWRRVGDTDLYYADTQNAELKVHITGPDDLLGVDITEHPCKMPRGQAALTALNADMEEEFGFEDDVESIRFGGNPSISFTCLANLVYKGPDRSSGVMAALADDSTRQERAAVLLAKQELQIIDFTGDEVLNLTKAERKQLDESRNPHSKVKPPTRYKGGYTLLSGRWHRSGFILVYYSRRDVTFLLGQDEETYFGVQLAENADTIEEALLGLRPDVARAPGVVRQGEWFVVPVGIDAVPAEEECILFTTGEAEFILPIDDPESNYHSLHAEKTRVTTDGAVYADNGDIEHPEHATVTFQGWNLLVRNTAVASTSVEGVD